MLTFSELTSFEFADFVKTAPTNNFLQSAEMFSRYKTLGKEAYLVGVRHAETMSLRAAALVVCIYRGRGQKIFSTPGGPVLDYTTPDAKNLLGFLFHHLKSFLKQHSGSVLQISPNLPFDPSLAETLTSLRFKNLGEYTQAKWISTLDLSKFATSDELFASFRDTCRHSIRYTDTRFHLETRELSRDELPILKHLSDLAGKKHSFRPPSLEYFESMFDAFGNNAKAVVAFAPPEPKSPEPKPLAGALFITYGSEVVYLYSGSDPSENKQGGSYAVQWYMLKFALENGYKTYNFYGTHPFENDGVFRFKSGFRAEVKELLGTFMLPLNLPGKLYTSHKKYQKYSDVV